MDIAAFIAIVFVIASKYLRTGNDRYVPLYSFSLFVLFFAGIYLFYRYGMREAVSTYTQLHFYASPIVLVTSAFLIFRQLKSTNGLQLGSYLKSLLSEKVIAKYDRYWFGPLTYVSITLLVFLAVTIYEDYYGAVDDPYSITISLPLWQLTYTIPLTALLTLVRLKRLAIGFFISWGLPLVTLLFVVLILDWL